MGIDYWPATTHAPGVGRYVRELVRALARLGERPELALFDVGPGPRVFTHAALGLLPDPRAPRVVRMRASVSRRCCGPAVAALGLGADVLLSLRCGRRVALFHRAFAATPGVSRAPEVLPVAELPPPGRARDEFARALERAALVAAMSPALARALAEDYGLDAAKSAVLPVGCDHWRRAAAVRDVAGERSCRRLLVLGALTPEREPLAIASAAAELVQGGRDVDLWFVGRPGTELETLRGSRAARVLGARLVVREPVEAELPEIVASSDVLVHLNRAEWTPVTPLEACAFGCAVVLSRLPAFEEALGPEAVWVGPRGSRSDAELVSALDAALDRERDPAGRGRRVALAAPFTWDRHARLTVELWNRILSP